MNLVAKEGPAANERDGVLVLSRTAGAFNQLAEAALPVTPTDIDETATELYEALVMSDRERARRAERARAVVEAESPAEWLLAQLEDALSSRSATSRRRSIARPRPHEVPVA
jgi:trehalose 6-phosphate synthase